MNTELIRRILAFMRDAEAGDFESLALELFADQFERFPEYRAQCRKSGLTPESVGGWRDIPIGSGESLAGTRTTAPDPLLAEAIRLALPDLFRAGAKSLVVDVGSSPSEADATKAGGNCLRAILDSASTAASSGDSVHRGERFDTRALRSWLAARQRDGSPVRIVASDSGHRALLDFLDRRGLKFRLPPGSIAYRLEPLEAACRRIPRDRLSEGFGLEPHACPRVACPRFGTPLLEDPATPGSLVLPHWVGIGPGDSAATILDLGSFDAPARRKAPASVARADGNRLFVQPPTDATG